MSDVSSGGDEDDFVQPPNLRLLRSGKTTVRRGREERARERTKVQREKRDTKLMLYRLKGKFPEDLRLPTPCYGNRQDRSKRWRRILKTQTGKGGASEDDSDSDSDSDDSGDDIATLGFNYRTRPTFDDDSDDYGDDYFHTPEDNFFPVSNKYRLGPEKLKRLQQKLTFSTPRGYYDNVRKDVLQREGLIGTTSIATSNNPIIIEDDNSNSDDDLYVDFQVEQFKDHLKNTHEKWHYTVDVSSDDEDDDDQLLFSLQ